MIKQSELARLPKVDQVLATEELTGAELPKHLIKQAVRDCIEDLRNQILEGSSPGPEMLEAAAVARTALKLAAKRAKPNLVKLINATGVVVHTNLGRSLLAKSAIERLVEINGAYSNLEYDLEAGKRGSRYSLVTDLLKEITGAEAALVVNNNAAAVFLSLQTLAAGREVVVSRGQLVEIGGSFRIPDVMARSGAILREVGATNKTHLHDYEGAITSNTAALLKVHTSNFAVVGFHKEVPLSELKELGLRYHIPVIEDLGSGTLLELGGLGLYPEPTVQQVLHDGADLVSFSGDKLLGGPQAGIILGKKDLVEKLRKNPMNRALRIDKLTLAALEATLELYRDPQTVMDKIPTLSMLSVDYEVLGKRAASLARRLKALGIPGLNVSQRDGESRVGGGAMPLAAPCTKLVELSLDGLSPTRLEEALRASEPPIICRLEDGRLLIDPRTLQSGDSALIAAAVARIAN